MVKKMIAAHRKLEPLPLDFVPGPNDVICARGKVAIKHSGNKKFMEIAKLFLKRYSESTTKVDKTGIVSEIISKVEELSPNGGFVKKVGEKWFLADLQLKREKISQALRNQLSTKYKSSTKAKRMQRQVKESMFDDEVDYALSQINCVDMFDQVEKLTSEAKNENDFQKAFNMVNMELLQRLKTLPPMAQFENPEEDDDSSITDSTSSVAPENAGSMLDGFSSVGMPSMSRSVSASSTMSHAGPPSMARAISTSSVSAAAPPSMARAISTSSVSLAPPAMARSGSACIPPPTMSRAASASIAPPTMARAASACLPTPAMSRAASASIAPPAMARACSGSIAPPSMARACSGSIAPPSMARACSGSMAPPSMARACSGSIAPPSMARSSSMSSSALPTPQLRQTTSASYGQYTMPMMARAVSGAQAPAPCAMQTPLAPSLARTVTAPTDNRMQAWNNFTKNTECSTMPMPSSCAPNNVMNQPLLGRATNRPLDLDDDEEDDDSLSPLPFEQGNPSADMSLFFDLPSLAANPGF